jgi:hypothetical protein
MNKKFCVLNVSGILGILAMTIVALGMSAPSLHAQAPAAGPPAPAPLAADMKGKTADQSIKKSKRSKAFRPTKFTPQWNTSPQPWASGAAIAT